MIALDVKNMAIYEIKILGKISEEWADWFDGFKILDSICEDGVFVTAMIGECDQSALRGIITRILDLNLKLISINIRSEL